MKNAYSIKQTQRVLFEGLTLSFLFFPFVLSSGAIIFALSYTPSNILDNRLITTFLVVRLIFNIINTCFIRYIANQKNSNNIDDLINYQKALQTFVTHWCLMLMFFFGAGYFNHSVIVLTALALMICDIIYFLIFNLVSALMGYSPYFGIKIINTITLSKIDNSIKQKLEKLSKDSGDATECVICMNNIDRKDTIVVLPCEHIYHKTCAYEWFRKKLNCPICRVSLIDDKNDNRKNYMTI